MNVGINATRTQQTNSVGSTYVVYTLSVSGAIEAE